MGALYLDRFFLSDFTLITARSRADMLVLASYLLKMGLFCIKFIFPFCCVICVSLLERCAIITMMFVSKLA